MAQELKPQNISVSGNYVLAQETLGIANFATFHWDASEGVWNLMPGKWYRYSPEEMHGAGWEIIEPATEFVYEVTDIWGARYSGLADAIARHKLDTVSLKADIHLRERY